MTRQRASATFLVAGVLAAAVAAPPSNPQRVLAADPDATSVAILQALRDNPLTAPYRFAVAARGKQYALSGRVGTKQVHDAAIRTMIALGYPVVDDLTIDTGEVNRVAAAQAAAGQGSRLPSAGLSYVYPPPLFGRLDDPFYGLEPPLVSYPPWFGAMTARREPLNLDALNGPNPGATAPVAPAAGMGAGVPLPNQVEMTLDGRGNATLRGRVPTLADRVAVGQEIARTPGIAQVINLLEVTGDARPALPPATVVSDVPPPLPTPAFPNGVNPRPPAPSANAGKAPVEEPTQAINPVGSIARRVSEAIARRPSLAAAPVKVTVRDGVVTLTGHVGSSYEAMLAFRAAQQTPGVREVVDRLDFPVPDIDRPNPLREKGRPEDVEVYLLAQIRRQVGDLAHVDTVRVRGDALEVRGTVSRADEVPRVEAALRSIPILRGFRLEPNFLAD